MLVVLLGGLALAFVAAYAYHLLLSCRRKGEAPVHWSWLPILGSSIQFGTQPQRLLEQCRDKYGDTFVLIVAGKRMTFVLNPHDASLVTARSKDLDFGQFRIGVSWTAFMLPLTTTEDEKFTAVTREHLYSPTEFVYLSKTFASLMPKMMTGLVSKEPCTMPLFDFVSKSVFFAASTAIFGPRDWAAVENAFHRFDAWFHYLAMGLPLKYCAPAKAAYKEFAKACLPGKGTATPMLQLQCLLPDIHCSFFL